MNIKIVVDTVENKLNFIEWVKNGYVPFYSNYSDDTSLEFEDIAIIGQEIILKDVVPSINDVVAFCSFALNYKNFGITDILLENI
ncbi:MAG TPA: hypothetical protein ENG48_12810 [Candidatus Atribacteria bacterium]|nr:hypothetical protein [Candidatus Atribacteria bacterium]